MPFALAGAVRIPSPEQHQHRRDAERYRVQQAGLDVGQAEGFDDLRLPQRQALARAGSARVDQRSRQYISVGEDLPERQMADLGFRRRILLRQAVGEPASLLAAQPSSSFGSIGQEEERDDPENDG